MAKQLIFTYDGKDYTLEFTRRTVAEMEKKGFIASDITEKPMTTLPALFAGAFLAHHRFVKEDVINDIYSKLTKKEDLIGKLAEMYNEPILALVEEPEKPRETWIPYARQIPGCGIKRTHNLQEVMNHGYFYLQDFPDEEIYFYL